MKFLFIKLFTFIYYDNYDLIYVIPIIIYN